MKKIISILVLALVLSISNTAAQSDKLDKFEGTWQWKSNDSIFTVILKKIDFNTKKFEKAMPDTTVSVLIGWHELKVMGKVVSSSMNVRRNTFDYDKKTHSRYFLKEERIISMPDILS